MGFYGWDLFSAPTTLTGVVAGTSWNARAVAVVPPFPDGDWSLYLKPDPEHAHYATNSRGILNPADTSRPGGAQEAGLVECEIQPADNSQELYEQVFAEIVGCRVSVTGAFVEDLSHDRKTEVHPIFSVLVEGPRNIWASNYRFYAFSDASVESYPTKPAIVWFSRTNLEVGFSAPFPPVPHPNLKVDLRRTAWRTAIGAPLTTNVDETKEPPVLDVSLWTGTPQDGAGLYAAEYVLAWTPVSAIRATCVPQQNAIDRPIEITIAAADSVTGAPIQEGDVLNGHGVRLGGFGQTFETVLKPWRSHPKPPEVPQLMFEKWTLRAPGYVDELVDSGVLTGATGAEDIALASR